MPRPPLPPHPGTGPGVGVPEQGLGAHWAPPGPGLQESSRLRSKLGQALGAPDLWARPRPPEGGGACQGGAGGGPGREKWVAPPPPLLLHSRKVAGSCAGRALPAAPSLEGRDEGVGEDRAVRAFLALLQHPPMWIQLPGTRPGALWDHSPHPCRSPVGVRGWLTDSLWALPGLGGLAENGVLELGAPGCAAEALSQKPSGLGGIQLLSWLKDPLRPCQDGGRGLQGSHPCDLGRTPPTLTTMLSRPALPSQALRPGSWQLRPPGWPMYFLGVPLGQAGGWSPRPFCRC